MFMVLKVNVLFAKAKRAEAKFVNAAFEEARLVKLNFLNLKK